MERLAEKDAHLTKLSSCVALLGSRSDNAHLVFAQSELDEALARAAASVRAAG